MSPRDIPQPLTIADRYRVESVLGRGGMATVYLCVDTVTGARVAVKVLREELGSAVVVERFLREIAFVSDLDHPGIPKVLDSGVLGTVPFYVMTYLEGESLRELLNREKQLPVDEVVRISSAVIDSMTYAHESGIVHRDIKPGNILVSSDRVHVLDFGIARAIIASADDSLTSTGVAVGTPAYMSPEQALADGKIDSRSDIYSLGCVIYEMLAGIAPFVGATPQAVMARRFGSPPPPLSEVREGVPPHVERAVSKALCRAPADRWQTAAEFGRALRNEQAPVGDDGKTIAAISRRKRRYALGITAVLALAVIGAAAYGWGSSNRNRVGRAHESLAAWDFAGAERELRAAVAERGGDPSAEMWLAQVLLLRRAGASEWAPFALRAADKKDSLAAEEKLRLNALVASAEHDHAVDCTAWRALVASGESDGSARLALADCLAVDDMVLPDSSSPSGYRFRSSFHEAANIYEGLLTRSAENPRAYSVILPRLERVLRVRKNNPRMGSLANGDHMAFAASPVLLGDSIAYVPYALSTDTPFRPASPEQLDRAVGRNILKTRDLASSWTRVAPNDPEARETFGAILEMAGQLDGGNNSAVREIAVARQLAGSESDTSRAGYVRRLRLASRAVGLNLKLRRFAVAAALADSVLAWPVPEAEGTGAESIDQRTSALAALTGRVSRVIAIDRKNAADYAVRLASGREITLPAVIGADVLNLLDYSCFGAPADSIRSIAARISTNLGAVFPAAQAEQARDAVLRRAFELATPAIGPEMLASLPPTRHAFARAVRALAGGRKHEARSFADSLSAIYADFAPGELTMDAVLQHGWLLAAVGDTSAAASFLDNALRGLSKMPPNTLTDPAIAAALVRTMLLRARLAAATRDSANAAVWGNAARALWGRGDAVIRATLDVRQAD